MTKATDFLLGDDGDLQISSAGDFQVGLSDRIHIEHIIRAYPGYYRNNLLCGVGIRSYMKSSGQEFYLQRVIRIQLSADNYDVSSVKADPGIKINVIADRIR